MLILLTLLSRSSGPYWNTLRRRLAEEKIAPLTITHAPNLIGHPIGIAALILSGTFLLPKDPLFFLFWLGMIAIAAVMSIFAILGLLHTKFFTTQVIGSLGFVSSSICAVIFLDETLGGWKILALCLAVVGVIVFSWKRGEKKLIFDRGIVFSILAVILSGGAAVLYKLATFHVPSYSSLVTGRFVADLIGWTIIWLISLFIIRRNPWQDMRSLVTKRYGLLYVFGFAAMTFIDAWLIYKLPVTTIAILGTVTFPITYFFSHFKYRERITPMMWLGTLLIVGSIIIFLSARS